MVQDAHTSVPAQALQRHSRNPCTLTQFPHLQLATGQRGLQDVGGVNSALRRASANQGVHLINHENDVVVLQQVEGVADGCVLACALPCTHTRAVRAANLAKRLRTCLISSISFFRRSSNSPRYLVPATSRPMSRVTICQAGMADSGAVLSKQVVTVGWVQDAGNSTISTAQHDQHSRSRNFLVAVLCMTYRISTAPPPLVIRVLRRTCLPSIVSGTSPLAIFWARPSATAVLPTPGSPIRHGLFLVRRPRICGTKPREKGVSTHTARNDTPATCSHAMLPMLSVAGP